jgi:LPS sulfotransferase NodH
MNLAELISVDQIGDKPKWNETILIAITARSGSTAICNALSDAGAAKDIGELFNPRGPFQMYFKLVGGCNIVQYLNGIYEHFQQTGKLIFKTAFDDLKPVLETHQIEKLFPGLRVINIDRINKVDQAVSLCRAMLTSEWHRDMSDKKIRIDRPDVMDYDFDFIQRQYTRIKQSSANWEILFRKLQLKPERVDYEQFLDDPQSVLSRLARYIGDLDVEGDFKIRQIKIADSLNHKWAEKFRRDLGI